MLVKCLDNHGFPKLKEGKTYFVVGMKNEDGETYFEVSSKKRGKPIWPGGFWAGRFEFMRP